MIKNNVTKLEVSMKLPNSCHICFLTVISRANITKVHLKKKFIPHNFGQSHPVYNSDYKLIIAVTV